MGAAGIKGDTAAGATPLIAADVGGTHARIALLDADARDGFAIRVYRKYACADYPSLAAIIDDFRAHAGARADRIALALPGCVIDDAVVNVNLPWSVSVSALREALGVRDIAIVNDFEAVAHAIGHVDRARATLLSGPDANPDGPILVVGPGTGLGAAIRIPHRGGAVVLGTEAGQATLAAVSDREVEILAELRAGRARVEIEHVLSGSGLSNLHRAIRALRGLPAKDLAPAEITAAALAGSDAAAIETADVFCAWLGAVLGDFALCYGAEGGVYLAGGVLPQMKALLEKSRFVERFLDKGVMRPLLEATPVRLIEHGELGVLGAASWYLGSAPARERAGRAA